jgi:hypothetical protein
MLIFALSAAHKDHVGKKEVAERTGIGDINEEIKCRR